MSYNTFLAISSEISIKSTWYLVKKSILTTTAETICQASAATQILKETNCCVFAIKIKIKPFWNYYFSFWNKLDK